MLIESRTIFTYGLLGVLLLALGPQASLRAEGGEGGVPLRVPRVESPVTVDGLLDEEAWRVALVVPADIEVEPGENIPAPVRTEFLLAYGPNHLFVGIRATDPDPSQIRARYCDRDKIWEDEWAGVVLDTFNDERRSFDFFCNPLGVQGDLIETADGGGGDAWDAIWDSAGRITADGYQVEMAIPFSSLRFQKTPGDQVWGLDAVRSYPRGVRRKFGAFPRQRGNNCYLCQTIKISGFAGADPGRNLELDPTVSLLYAQHRPQFPDGPMVKKESSAEPGITVRWSPTPNTALNGTLNPDFSQVEADAAQLDVNTRFALFYPEKRPFFLEGMDYFETQLPVVYTRTLADPAWGIKATGKAGGGTVACFSVQDRVTNLILPGTEFSRTATAPGGSLGSVFRYRQDIGRSSTLGIMATDREGTGYFNRVLGADAVLRFGDNDTLRMSAYGSQTRYPDGIARDLDQPRGKLEGGAFDLFYIHGTRDWEAYVHYQDFGTRFRADMGFMPQVGYSFLDFGVLRNWYSDAPGHWFNAIKVWVGYELTRDPEGERLREVYGSFVEYRGPKESSLFATLYLGKQAYAGKTFDHDTFNMSAWILPTGDLHLGLGLFYGDDVDYAGVRQATRLRLSPSVLWYCGRHLQLQLAHSYERLWVDAGRLYAAHLTELRAVYQFTARSFLRAILQNTDNRFESGLYPYPVEPRFKSLMSQVLFSYKINPQTAFYAGYSDRFLGDAKAGLTQVDRALFVKVGYAWVR